MRNSTTRANRAPGRICLGLALLAVSFAGPLARAADGDIEYASSLWSKQGQHKTSGLYTIEQRGDGYTLTLSSDFKTKPGPGLELVLSPLAPKDTNSKNALRDAVVLGPLQSPTDAQEYPIDPSVDLASFHSVVIYSAKKSRLWSAAALLPGEVIARGDTWKKKTRKTRGAFEIARTTEGRVIRFANNFKTAKAPEPLRVIISEHTTKAASNKNAMERGRVVGTMSRYKGGQSYPLPGDVELRPGMTLLLHCEKYTKLWSAAEIRLVSG